MLATHLGFYNTASTRTHVRFQFSTHAAAGGNVAPNSAFEAADIRIYRANDGAATSATQRSSSAGITMTSPFDSLTGFHDVDIDLTENTDAGFYASGYQYSVVLAPDETVDGQTITAVVLAYFEIGTQPVNVTHAAGTAWNSGAIVANTIATGAIDADSLAADAGTEIGTAVWATAARTLTALDEDSTTLDLDATIRAAVGLAAANLDTQLTAIDDAVDTEIGALTTAVADLPTNAELATALGTADDAVLAAVATVDTVVDAIKVQTDKFVNLPVLTEGGTGGQGYGAPP